MSLPPQPQIDPDSADFWKSLSQHQLRIQYSPAAERWQFPPLERCRFTGEALEWRAVSPRGMIASFIVQHRPVSPGYDALLPYPIALIDLDDAPGARIPMRIAESHGDGVRVGSRVTIAFEHHPGGDFHVAVARLASV
ncbi:MAG: OB-fold domain-containing protein [Pseudomonadota bacterium]|nr:OB-fold domain-containing protein [Pseudomonadota bacterium]